MKKPNIKIIALSLVLGVILLATVGTTLAYIIDTASVTNEFSYMQVSCAVKQSDDSQQICVTNTSDIPVYIRARVIVTWTDGDGNISAKSPVYGTDYTVSMNTESWTLKGDGIYYCSGAVAAGADTDMLVTSVTPHVTKDGYKLTVEVVAEAIQSVPDDAVIEAWGFIP